MQRLRHSFTVLAWQTGVGYLVLWSVTYWTLADGAAFFGQSAACHADSAQALFYWACDPPSPLESLASLANLALTVTVWAPIFVVAATVDPDALIIAVPIVALHVIGLPLGLLVLIRVLARIFDAVRALGRRLWAAVPAAGRLLDRAPSGRCPTEGAAGGTIKVAGTPLDAASGRRQQRTSFRGLHSVDGVARSCLSARPR